MVHSGLFNVWVVIFIIFGFMNYFLKVKLIRKLKIMSPKKYKELGLDRHLLFPDSISNYKINWKVITNPSFFGKEFGREIVLLRVSTIIVALLILIGLFLFFS